MIASPSLCAGQADGSQKKFNVISYGAVGNGKTDDTEVRIF
jgi:hypothetical protein